MNTPSKEASAPGAAAAIDSGGREGLRHLPTGQQQTEIVHEGRIRACQVCGAPGRHIILGGYEISGCDFHIQVRA